MKYKKTKLILSGVATILLLTGCSNIGKEVRQVVEAGKQEVAKIVDSNDENDIVRRNEYTLKGAIIFGCLEEVKEVLDKGVDINMLTKVSELQSLKPEKSPIWMAIFNSEYKIVEYLIDRGADLNYSKNVDGKTVFVEFMKDQYCLVVKFLPLLIEHGANINDTSERNWTPLEVLVTSDKIPDIYKIELTEELIKNGAEVRPEALDYLLNSMTGYIADETGGIGCMGSRIVPFIEQIVKQQGELEITNIQQAAIEGDSDKVLELVKKGEYETEELEEEWKLCGSIAGYCNVDALKACMEKSEFNEFQINSLLIVAARGNKLENVKFIINQGADINYMNEGRYSPLVMALLNDYTDIIEYLLDAGAKLENSQWTDAITEGKSEACAAALNENKEMLEKILKMNEALPEDEQEEIISQVFNLCAYYNKEDFAEYLFQQGYADKASKGILSDICCEENSKIVQMFIESGADIEGDGGEASALQFALSYSTPDVVQLLVDNGAQMDFSTVLYAIWGGEMDKIKILVEAGADLTMINEEGKTLLEASEGYSENVKAYLIEHGAK